MTGAEIGSIGERHVEHRLTATGWKCKRDTQLPGSTDIEAEVGEKKILVQVKTAVSPATPADLSAEELRNIKSRENRSRRQACLAKVTVRSGGQLAQEIEWLQLK